MAVRTYTVAAADGFRFRVTELVRTQLVEDGHLKGVETEAGDLEYRSPLDRRELESEIHRARAKWGAWIS